jgi:hypothetical protein
MIPRLAVLAAALHSTGTALFIGIKKMPHRRQTGRGAALSDVGNV